MDCRENIEKDPYSGHNWNQLNENTIYEVFSTYLVLNSEHDKSFIIKR